MRYLLILTFVGLSFNANAEMPIYAAYASDELAQSCEIQGEKRCQLNPFDADTLTRLLRSIEASMLIEDALSLSEYEVLIGNALININEQSQRAEVVLEITTVWRQVPIDDVIIRKSAALSSIDDTARVMLAEWAQHIETNLVLEADKIYQVLGASDYTRELYVPESIGDFTRQQSAVYRDPLLGSVTRYFHPRFESAVVDISVYPFSPYVGLATQQSTALGSNASLHAEMENEIAQIRQSIAQAKIEDFTISSILPAAIRVNGELLNGLRLEVLLHPNTDPQYSTQYIFQQNDKIIKLTGNLPEYMMSDLVNESLPKIRVPLESSFMRALRQG